MPMRVLVVGAGPTGLTAAVELARRGIIADVVDRKEQASTLSRAVGILPGTLRTLAPSGVADRLVAMGVKLQDVQVFREQKSLARIPILTRDEPWHHFIGLPQDLTESVLLDAFVAAGGAVRFSCGLETLVQDNDTVQAGFSDGSSAAYDYVIGADGTSSRVRVALGIAYPGYQLDETWSIADVASEKLRPGSLSIWRLTAGRVVMAISLDEQGRFRLVSNTENALQALPSDIGVSGVRREGQFQIDVRQVDLYHRGRVALAGDAAHCHSPVGGRGMNLGIADAADLAERLAMQSTGGSTTDFLSDYGVARHAIGKQVIRDSEQGRRAMVSSNPVVSPLVDRAFWLIGKNRWLQHRFARQTLDVAF